ncbi:MAG: hypothetical protein IPL49_08720 [Saprospirales bacterium]|nr:hypothetical protein [Saprospirales bacterium]MBK8490953.1 hypothetical protein [Saprospirales bacterium]
MIRIFQISLTYLGLVVFLLHGAIPHHHHEDVFEPDCNGLVHLSDAHECGFSNPADPHEAELVCHLHVVTVKPSMGKYVAVVPVQLMVFSLEVPRIVAPLGCAPPVFSKEFRTPRLLRGPPAIA